MNNAGRCLLILAGIVAYQVRWANRFAYYDETGYRCEVGRIGRRLIDVGKRD